MVKSPVFSLEYRNHNIILNSIDFQWNNNDFADKSLKYQWKTLLHHCYSRGIFYGVKGMVDRPCDVNFLSSVGNEEMLQFAASLLSLHCFSILLNVF